MTVADPSAELQATEPVRVAVCADAGAATATRDSAIAIKSVDTAAMIFWLKARAGWREKQHVEVTGPNGAPLPVPVVNVTVRRLSAIPLTEEEWIATHGERRTPIGGQTFLPPYKQQGT